ncbi:MAG: response regulator [Hyphomicrobium sp.]
MTVKILIVEDEPILAIELESIVKEMGHDVVGVAASSRAALRIAADTQPDIALVDVHLTDGATGPDAARRLAEDGKATVLFTTSNPERVPADFANACGVLTKPYSDQSIRSAIAYITECKTEGRASRPKPHMLKLAPSYRERWRS